MPALPPAGLDEGDGHRRKEHHLRMDRRVLEDHLRQAKQHAWVGLQHIRRQREILEELERDGHDTAMGRTLLKTYEGTQRGGRATAHEGAGGTF